MGTRAGEDYSQDQLLRKMETSIDVFESLKSKMLIQEVVPADANDKQWVEMKISASKHSIQSSWEGIATAACRILIKTPISSDCNPDYLKIGKFVAQLTYNMTHLAKHLKLYIALECHCNNRSNTWTQTLTAAATSLFTCAVDLLNATKSETVEWKAQNSAIRDMADAQKEMMKCIGDVESEVQEKRKEDTLDYHTTYSAQYTCWVVMRIANTGTYSAEEKIQFEEEAAREVKPLTVQLCTCSQVLEPIIYNPSCQQIMKDAAKEVAYINEGYQHTALENNRDNEDFVKRLTESYENVMKRIDGLFAFIRRIARSAEPDEQEQVVKGCVETLSTTHSTTEMIQQAKLTARNSSAWLKYIEQRSRSMWGFERKKLLAAAKQIEDATKRMVEAAEEAEKDPEDEQCHVAFQQATKDLRHTAETATSENLEAKLMAKLLLCAKIAATFSTQLVAAAEGADCSIDDILCQQALKSQFLKLSGKVCDLVGTMNAYSSQPGCCSKQRDLLQDSLNFTYEIDNCITVAKNAVPHVTDKPSALLLQDLSKTIAAQRPAGALRLLRSVIDSATKLIPSPSESSGVSDLERQSSVDNEQENEDIPSYIPISNEGFLFLTDQEKVRRNLEAELDYFSLKSDCESPWYDNMKASLKFYDFIEIINRFPKRGMLKMSKQKRKDMVNYADELFNKIDSSCEVFKIKDYHRAYYDPMVGDKYSFIQSEINYVKELVDNLLDGDIIYKVASESLLKNGVNSLGPTLSEELMRVVKFICCLMRVWLVYLLVCKDDEAEEKEFKQAAEQNFREWMAESEDQSGQSFFSAMYHMTFYEKFPGIPRTLAIAWDWNSFFSLLAYIIIRDQGEKELLEKYYEKASRVFDLIQSIHAE